MLRWERKLLEWLDRRRAGALIVAISILALLIRIAGRNVVSSDYQLFLSGWFDEIREMGGLKNFSGGGQVGDYNVVYQFIVALLTCLPFKPLHMYKAVSILFDYVLAISAGWLVSDLCDRKRDSFALTYALVLILPTCFLNSAFWAQCDSIYVSFAILCIIFMLRERFVLAFVFFGLSFAMKLQAVFILPFILYYYAIKKKFSALYALIPLGINILPCVLCGRHPLDTFFIYLDQTGLYKQMTMNSSSFWGFFPDKYHLLGPAALMMTIAMLGIGLFVLLQKKSAFESNEQKMYALIWTAWTSLVFLPSMHERYSYIIEILLIVATVMNHRMFPFAVLVELEGIVRATAFLWNSNLKDQFGIWLTMLYLAAYAGFTLYYMHRVAEAPELAQERGAD